MDQKMDEALNIPSYYTSEDNLDFSDYDLDGNEIGKETSLCFHEL